jgi:hypothetical protein
MMAYNKLIAAIVSALLVRWFLQWSGIDITAIGVEEDLRLLVSVAIDFAAAGVSGFFVWLVPNIKKALD